MVLSNILKILGFSLTTEPFFNNFFLSLAYAFQKDIAVITQENFAGVSICNFRKSLFVSVPLKLMVLSKLNNQPLMTFYDYLYYFIEAKKVDVIVCDCNIDACSKSRLPQILSEYVQLVEFSTHTAGSTFDHVYVKKSFLEDYEVEIVVLNTYFSDHDAVRVKISEKDIDFINFRLKMIKTAIHLEYFYIYSRLCTHLKCGFNNIVRILQVIILVADHVKRKIEK